MQKPSIASCLAVVCALSSPPLVALIGGCDQGGAAPSGPHVAIAIAPVTYLGVSDACYTLTTYDASYKPSAPDAGIVWRQEHLCGSHFGFDGSISYVGTCVAGETNTVTLVLENLYEGGAVGPLATNAIDVDEYVNPCPAGKPCVQAAPCKENEDVSVTFDLTVMRDANQGFFDIAVNFEDIFCSAKIDCQYGDGTPIDLLYNPRLSPSERDSTAVLAFACTSGDDEATTLHMNDLMVTCGTTSWPIDPSLLEGNYYAYPPDGSGAPAASPIYQAQIADGVEPIANVATGKPAHKVYWTIALGIDTTRFASGGCTVSTSLSASNRGGATWRSPGTMYPQIDVSLPLTYAQGELTCGHHGLDGKVNGVADPVIATGYSHGKVYRHCLVGDFASGAARACRDVYDATPSPLPGNLVSLGYEATATAELGDALDIGGSGTVRALTVVFSDWALHSSFALDPIYGPDAVSWTHPITVNVYAVGPNDGNGLATVGAKLGSVTETVTVPWRPEADPVHCTTNPTQWWNGTGCFNGKAFEWTFDLHTLGITVPRRLIFAIAYDTANYGSHPIGPVGPYNSLNVGLSDDVDQPANLSPDALYWNTSVASFYTDGGAAGVGVLRFDTGWDLTPAYRVVAY